MTELTLIDIGELIVVGILAAALNFAVVEYVKRRIWLLSKPARRFAPTIVGLLLTLPGLPLAVVWLTPVAWSDLNNPPTLAGLGVLGLLLGIANAGGAQWAHGVVKSILERLGDRAPDFLSPK